MRKRGLLFNLKISLLSLLLSILAAEIILALLGYRASPYASKSLFFSPGKSLIVSDPLQGWRYAPGEFTVPMGIDSRKNGIVIEEHGGRYTGKSPDGNSGVKPNVFLLGGSITFGFGLSDEETLGFKLQTALPNKNIYNFAVTGYGTYQSILSFATKVTNVMKQGDTVIYGFCSCHIDRNVAHPNYLVGLASRSSTGNISMPYCDIDNNQLVCYPPAPFYKENVFRHGFRLANLMQAFMQRARINHCDSVKNEVSNRLLIQLQDDVIARGGNFYVLPVDNSSSTYLRNAKLYTKTKVIECEEVDLHKQVWQLRDDPHPNSRWTSNIASCIRDQIMP